MGGLLGGGGQRVCWPLLSNYWEGAGRGLPLPRPPSSYAYAEQNQKPDGNRLTSFPEHQYDGKPHVHINILCLRTDQYSFFSILEKLKGTWII